MKVLKASGIFLQQLIKLKERSVPISLIILFGLIYLDVSFNFGYVYRFIILLIVSYSFLIIIKEYSYYKQRVSEQNLVVQSLQSLNDDYFLINDIFLRESQTKIDHIVLGPTGIFVIVTENYSGQITCDGDHWQGNRDYVKRRPSRHVKRGAVKIKQIIESLKVFRKPPKVWVEGIVLFTNQNVKLQLSNATVPILQIYELNRYITSKKSEIKFSPQELELIGKAILDVG